MFCQQNIINLLTKLVKKYVVLSAMLLLPCFDMRCGYFAAFFPTSEADRTSAFLPHLWVMSSSHFSLFDASRKKGIFFLHQTQKCGCYKILSSSSSFFDFLIIFVTNLQRVKCSSFFKRLQMNKTRCFPKNCTFYDFTEKWVKKTLKMD